MRFWRTALVGAMVFGGVVGAVAVDAPQLIALGVFEPGQWQLKEAGTAGPGKAMCVADPRALLQLQHNGAQCTRFVIANTRYEATIRYTCPGAGHGRTTIKVETGRLMHVQTQGIENGAPFDHDYEASRTGSCGGGTR